MADRLDLAIGGEGRHETGNAIDYLPEIFPSGCLGAFDVFDVGEDGEPAHNVYEMVVLTVEKPILEVAMEQAAGNQSVAAEILGINRNTLRKKLEEYGLERP